MKATHDSPFWRRIPVVLVAIVMAGALLRFWDLGRQSLWMDEAYSVWDAMPPWGELHRLITASPPLFYYLLKIVYGLVGNNDFWLRSLPALFGTLTIPALYVVLNRFSNRSTALWGAFLLAFSLFHIMYSQELRMFTMATLEVVLALYFFHQASEETNARSWVYFSLISITGFYTHYWFAFFILGFFLTYLASSWQRPFSRPAVLAFASIGVACLLWLPQMRQQASTPATAHMVPTTWDQAAQTLLALTSVQMTIGAVTLEVHTLMVPLLILPLLLVAVGLFWPHPQRRQIISLFMAGCALPLTLAWMESHWFKPVYFPSRYTVMALPGFLIPIAAAMTCGGRRFQFFWRVLLGVWLAATISLLPVYYMRFNKGDWKIMAQKIQHDYRPGDAVWLGGLAEGWIAMHYYLPPSIPRIPDLFSAAPSVNRVFVPEYGYSGQADAFPLSPHLSAHWHAVRVTRFFRSSLIELESNQK